MIETPVLLLTFNRPDYTKKVFDAIKSAKPKKLYVFNDGPRKGNGDDVIAREKIRQLIKQVDWNCELKLSFSEVNLGCGKGVSSAIHWAFNSEDRLLILEDDTVPAFAFFEFCNRLLEAYKDDDRIYMISGNNFTPQFNNTDMSYFFTKYGHIWGWATWKRAWDKYDYQMKTWINFRNINKLNAIFKKPVERRFFSKYFDDVYKNIEKRNAWAPQWFYCRIYEAGLSIIPQTNLVTNIGTIGTHTQITTNTHNVPVNTDYFILNEPESVSSNQYYDSKHFSSFINKKKSFIKRIVKKLNRILK